MRNFALLLLLLSITGSALAQAVSSEPYRLRPEDVIAIRVYGEEEMSVDSPINLDGTISVPLLGFINVAGKTTSELEAHITLALKTAEYFVDPKVSDNTPAETATYDERSGQIAGEMFYLMSAVGSGSGARASR